MQDEANKRLARRLEATGHYKVLRRVVPRPVGKAPESGARIGVVLDCDPQCGFLRNGHNRVRSFNAERFPGRRRPPPRGSDTGAKYRFCERWSISRP